MVRTPDIGTALREDRTRIDFAALRAARRARVFAEMERLGIDACLFGRETNARYTAGHRRLWTSNTRAYMPTCIAIRSTGQVHVMALGASVEDASEDLPPENVYGRSFDPATLLGVYAGIPGLAAAKRVGVDGLTIGMRTMIGHVCPQAEIVGFESSMRALRRVKLPIEIDCLRVAIAIGEASLQRAADGLRPGVSGRALLATYTERMAQLGTTTFADQGTFHAAVSGPTPPFGVEPAAFEENSAVVLAGGAQWAGYEGALARTWWCGEGPPSDGAVELYRRWRLTMDALFEACRPGRTGHDLVAAYTHDGEPLPGMPIAHSVGMGHEGPVAGSPLGESFDATQTLEPDMVLTLRAWVRDDRTGHLGEEIVRIGADGPECLTTMSHGAIARAATDAHA